MWEELGFTLQFPDEVYCVSGRVYFYENTAATRVFVDELSRCACGVYYIFLLCGFHGISNL